VILSIAYDLADLLDSKLKVRRGLRIRDAEDQIASDQQFVIALTVLSIFGVDEMFRSVEFYDHSSVTPEEINAGRLSEHVGWGGFVEFK
jgi:hypothetical protein